MSGKDGAGDYGGRPLLARIPLYAAVSRADSIPQAITIQVTYERSDIVPATTIEVRRRYSPEQESKIIDAVHAAMMEGLKVPEWDKTVRFISHEPHRFTAGPGKDERFTLISIDLFEGRSLQAKRLLYSAIVRNLAPFDIPPDHVKVLLREIPMENWGIRGAPASEMEIGFEVKV